MGRFSVEIRVTNDEDLVLARRGVLASSDVREIVIRGLVDTGATRLVLPISAVRALGLPEAGETTVKFADGRRAKRNVVSHADVAIQGRSGTFSAVVERNRTEALIGAIVLEELDFVVDCVAQKLVPRDPGGTTTEIE